MVKKTLLTLIFLFALSASAWAAAAFCPLEIIQPRPSTATNFDGNNRYSTFYAGIEYNVKVNAICGLAPFKYSLTQAPAGMTINSSTGVISWPGSDNVNAPSNFLVTAQIIDDELTTTSVQWYMVKATSAGGKFLFVDSTNGHHSACNTATPGTATGSISDPFLDESDWYCGNDSVASGTTQYAGRFIYYRGGATPSTAKTYFGRGFRDCLVPNGRSCLMILGNGNKPVVHMCYPGEYCNMDFSGGGWAWGRSDLNHTADNAYMEGFKGINIAPNPPFVGSMFVLWIGLGDNITVRRNDCSHTPRKDPVLVGNMSCFFIAGLPGDGPSKYTAVTENVCFDLQLADCTLVYGSDKGLFEYNTVDTVFDPQGQYPPLGIHLKGCPHFWSVRNNNFSNIGTTGQPSAAAIQTLSVTTIHGFPCKNGNYDIQFNLVKNSPGRSLDIDADPFSGDHTGAMFVRRNTFINQSVPLFHNIVSASGPFTLLDNIFVNNRTEANHIACVDSCDPTQVTAKLIAPLVPAAGGNLVGFPADNIVDANGALTAAYSQYVGFKGIQVTNVSAPAQVMGVNVQ